MHIYVINKCMVLMILCGVIINSRVLQPTISSIFHFNRPLATGMDIIGKKHVKCQFINYLKINVIYLIFVFFF